MQISFTTPNNIKEGKFLHLTLLRDFKGTWRNFPLHYATETHAFCFSSLILPHSSCTNSMFQHLTPTQLEKNCGLKKEVQFENEKNKKTPKPCHMLGVMWDIKINAHKWSTPTQPLTLQTTNSGIKLLTA